ncbi:hypothetical protein DRQ12_02915 [candidate division KSB1 bacterium]|nr:MAG: hypothetical protein DRQ12_02915 [candidate division KSB1 bacterium]
MRSVAIQALFFDRINRINPRFGKTPLKIFLSLAQILLKNANFTENGLHSTLKTDVGIVSRR